MTVRFSKEKVRVGSLWTDKVGQNLEVGQQVCFGNGLKLTFGHILWIDTEGRVTIRHQHKSYHRNHKQVYVL